MISPTAIPDGRLEEILRVTSSTGDDPALDALLLRLHVETACRRGGVLALAPEDLDPEDCLIQLQATLGLVEAVKAHAVLESGSRTLEGRAHGLRLSGPGLNVLIARPEMDMTRSSPRGLRRPH